MKAKRTHDLVATVGEYTNRDGEKKKRYQNCGSVFTGEDGRMSIKLEALPISKDWSGFMSLYEVEAKQEKQEAREPAETQGNATAGDIPF